MLADWERESSRAAPSRCSPRCATWSRRTWPTPGCSISPASQRIRAVKPPIPNSYWVEPGRCWRANIRTAAVQSATRARIEALLRAGVRCFIDLTEAARTARLQRAAARGRRRTTSFPLPDHSVPRNRAADARGAGSAAGRSPLGRTAVYVHCRAGIGRTGITIGCYLREQGESADGALAELNRLWQQNARAARWPSTPETRRAGTVHPRLAAAGEPDGARAGSATVDA